MNLERLKDIIRKHRIDTSSWRKSIDDLYHEIYEGSSQLIEKNGKLFRTVNVAVMFCTNDKKTFLATYKGKEMNLIEPTLSEKCNASETYEAACIRGLDEELGILQDKDYSKLVPLAIKTEQKDSHSYSGLPTLYEYRAFFIKTNTEISSGIKADHDGKQLRILKIMLEEFAKPNNLFIHEVKNLLQKL